MAFIVWKKVVGSIPAAYPYSGDSSSSGSQQEHTTSVIQVCAPNSNHEHEGVEQFYEQIDSIITKTPKKDILAVQGD